MRTVAIIDIIRKYGLRSKRLKPRNRIKYEKALKALNSYKLGALKIENFRDLYSLKNPVYSRCDICHHRIRFEYTVVNTVSGETYKVGTTCCLTLLGIDGVDKKEFLRLEGVVRNRDDAVKWKEAHKDIYDKMVNALNHGFYKIAPFIEELDVAPLMEKDENYVLGLDYDNIIKSIEHDKRVKEEKRIRKLEHKNVYRRSSDEFENAVKALEILKVAYPTEFIYKGILNYANRFNMLTARQIKVAKVGMNRKWYEENIKNTDKDMSKKEVDDIIVPILKKNNFKPASDIVFHGRFIDKVNKVISTMGEKVNIAWKLYRVNHEIVR